LAITWTLDLNPLPSEIVHVSPVGKDLSVVMGTIGHVGLTTPAFAETYYAFYRWAAILTIPLGMLLSFFDRLPRRLTGAPGVVCWALAALCFPLGLHSGCRTMTRPLLYGAVLYGFAKRGRRTATNGRVAGGEMRTPGGHFGGCGSRHNAGCPASVRQAVGVRAEDAASGPPLGPIGKRVPWPAG
jgi:hypothetical protein